MDESTPLMKCASTSMAINHRPASSLTKSIEKKVQSCNAL